MVEERKDNKAAGAATAVAGAGAGAVAGCAATPAILGVTATGPVGGGVFAAFQSWGWVTAGGSLASTQSAIMTGSATAGPVGLAIGGTVALALGIGGYVVGKKIFSNKKS